MRNLLESIIAVATTGLFIAACSMPTHGQPRIIHLHTMPDVCDTIITDGQPQKVCTEVTYIR